MYLIYLPTYLSTYLSIHLSIYPPTYLSFYHGYIFTYSIYLSVYIDPNISIVYTTFFSCPCISLSYHFFNDFHAANTCAHSVSSGYEYPRVWWNLIGGEATFAGSTSMESVWKPKWDATFHGYDSDIGICLKMGDLPFGYETWWSTTQFGPLSDKTKVCCAQELALRKWFGGATQVQNRGQPHGPMVNSQGRSQQNTIREGQQYGPLDAGSKKPFSDCISRIWTVKVLWRISSVTFFQTAEDHICKESVTFVRDLLQFRSEDHWQQCSLNLWSRFRAAQDCFVVL